MFHSVRGGWQLEEGDLMAAWVEKWDGADQDPPRSVGLETRPGRWTAGPVPIQPCSGLLCFTEAHFASSQPPPSVDPELHMPR